jgi:hypothetical protein
MRWAGNVECVVALRYIYIKFSLKLNEKKSIGVHGRIILKCILGKLVGYTERSRVCKLEVVRRWMCSLS